jgi:hypothetical protein
MSAPSQHPQPAVTVALIGVPAASEETLRAAFRLFSIETQNVNGNVRQALQARHFAGCVVRLDAGATAVIEFLRKTAAYRHLPILGLYPQGAKLGEFAKLGLNAIVHEPVVEAEAVKVVRGVHTFIRHEPRRHVRIPIVLETEVKISGAQAFSALTHDLSYGGISVTTEAKVFPDNDVEISFRLPNGEPATVNGTIVWRHHPNLLGIRFAAGDERGNSVRQWIDEYLRLY